MSPEPKKVSEAIHEENLGSLRGCLVDGDAEQRTRERRIRRRALAISIFLQSAVLATLILAPMFSKAERISVTIATPTVPYGHPRSHPQGNARTGTSRPHNRDLRFTFHPPTNNVNHRSVEDANPIGSLEEFDQSGNARNDGSGCSGCVDIGGRKTGPRPPQPPVETSTRTKILHVTRIDPAMLIRRVEPVYPALARQTHREGRVELRAIIGTDGTIQSLQVVSGDPLFLMSAKEAVEQWRYKPTYLNGQAVEIDTFITVVYTMQH
jgi:TonB family protein